MWLLVEDLFAVVARESSERQFLTGSWNFNEF